LAAPAVHLEKRLILTIEVGKKTSAEKPERYQMGDKAFGKRCDRKSVEMPLVYIYVNG